MSAAGQRPRRGGAGERRREAASARGRGRVPGRSSTRPRCDFIFFPAGTSVLSLIFLILLIKILVHFCLSFGSFFDQFSSTICPL